MSAFLYITYHEDIPLPYHKEYTTMPIGCLSEEIFNEVNRRNPTIGKSDLVQVRLTGCYIFVYVNGDRLDCELPIVGNKYI
jgi:hypothetical protein